MNSIYEINTPIFLHEVGQRARRHVTLADVPDSEWDAIARPGIDTVWFMGVWKRSSIARTMALEENETELWLQKALPDLQDDDVIGSAYSIQEYSVDASLGGDAGLAVAREALKKRGIKIILDYVPNHVAIDHEWATEHPDYFLSGTTEELNAQPEAFVQTPGGIFAKGKDPNFDPWSDVLQLNAFSPSLRREVVNTLRYIASISDGVRCDMAMLMMNTIFKTTWNDRVGEVPATEYWPEIITAIHADRPDFLFIAEVYWDKQQELLDQGFDLCYDKDLYDYLLKGSVHDIKAHLQKPIEYQQHLLRFIENHDEERAGAEFTTNKHIAAAVITATLPGAHLYHDGEYEGRKVRVPVHLGRRVEESPHPIIVDFYDKLLRFVQSKGLTNKQWQPVSIKSGFLRRESHHVVGWIWEDNSSGFAVFVNYSAEKVRVTPDVDVTKARVAIDVAKGVIPLTEHIIGSDFVLGPWQHVVIEF